MVQTGPAAARQGAAVHGVTFLSFIRGRYTLVTYVRKTLQLSFSYVMHNFEVAREPTRSARGCASAYHSEVLECNDLNQGITIG